MREILFRGKRVDNGEWVYGYPFVDTAPCSLKEKGHCKCPHDGSDAAIFAWVDAYHEYDDFWVAPETVGQYTGLTDKNGTKIFEGDILRYSYDYEGSPWLTEDIRYHQGAVFWSEWRGSWAVCARGKDDRMNQDVHVYCRNPNRVEVIGNIHDNPELLTEATS